MLQLVKLLPYLLILAAQTTSLLAQRGTRSPLTDTNKPTVRIPIPDSIYGERNVTYFVTNDGNAIIDGGAIYGAVDQLLVHDLRNSNSNDKELDFCAFSVWATGRQAWPSGNLLYRYAPDDTATLLTPIIDTAIARWQAGAPRLTFTRLFPNGNAAENGVVVISATNCGGYNAHVGYTANGPRSMNIERACPADPNRGVCGVMEATHEFGHALGFYHEHQRPNRETTVHYSCANPDPLCPAGTFMPVGKTCCDTSGIPSGCCTRSSNFAIISGSSTTFDSSGAYDVTSLMQYCADAFARPATNTLTPALRTTGVIIPATNPATPSTQDFNRLCNIYSGTCPRARACKNAGCPTACAIMRQCNNPILCSSEFGPPRCDLEAANEACLVTKALCATMDCAFMGQ